MKIGPSNYYSNPNAYSTNHFHKPLNIPIKRSSGAGGVASSDTLQLASPHFKGLKSYEMVDSEDLNSINKRYNQLKTENLNGTVDIVSFPNAEHKTFIVVFSKPDDFHHQEFQKNIKEKYKDFYTVLDVVDALDKIKDSEEEKTLNLKRKKLPKKS